MIRIVFSSSRPGCAGAFGAFDPLGVEERDGADHRDRDRQVDRGDPVGDLGQVERDHGRVEDVLAGGRGAVEHPAQRPVAEPLQRERDLPQLGLDVALGGAEPVGELGGRGAELLDDVGDADLGAVAAPVGFLERGGEADRFGLAERPAEHRAGDRLEQPLPQLAPPDPRQRVQPGAPAGREPEDRPAERPDEWVVFALEVDDLAAAAEHPRAQQPRLGEARLAEVGAADDERVRVVQDAAGVEDPGVVDEAAAVHVAADVDAARTEPGLGDRRIHGLEVRGRRLVPGPLARQRAATEPSDRAAVSDPGAARARGARRSASAARWRSGPHLSPRQSGSPNVNAERLLAPHPLQPERRGLGLEVDAGDGGLELVAGVGSGVGDADRDVGAVADVRVPLGELGLLARGGVFALALALAGALPDPAAEAVLGRGLGHRPLGLADRAGRADELHAHRDRAGRVRPHQQRLQEHRADVDPRPLRHPQRAMQRPVGPQMRPVLVARGGRGGVRRGAVLGVGVLVAVALAAAPRVIPVADRSGETAAGQHAGRCDAGAVEQLDQPPDLAGEHGHRAESPPPRRATGRRAAGRRASIWSANSSSCSSAT